MKPSMWTRILHDLELDPATQIYDEEIGHVAFLDSSCASGKCGKSADCRRAVCSC